MVVLIALIVVVVIAIGVVAVVATRRRKSRVPGGPPSAAEAAPSRPPSAPMTDLEAALANVTDRSGRPIQERIDAEATHVDELRIPNDTGPLLRRALDSVTPEHDTGGTVADDDTGDHETDDT